jgi:hypothetical protein
VILLFLSNDLGNSRSNSHGQCEQNEQAQNETVVELRRSIILYSNMYRNELLAMILLSKKYGPMILSRVRAYEMFTFGIPRSCS